MKPTCSLESLRAVWEFAKRYDTRLGVNLIHYSLPYFNEGKDRHLQFTPDDAENIKRAVDELARFKSERPDLLPIPSTALRSVPDWLLKGPDMKVPCNAGRLIWIGADGTVQLCYVTFKLGNLHEGRLIDMVHTKQHKDAARRAFELDCPNCHCSYDKRTLGHLPSRLKYHTTNPA
jgi:cyclic pyranopterin phosphate synthase